MTVTSILLELATALLLSICTAYVINQTLYSPLRHVPGPAIAKLTNIYQLVVYYQGRQVRVIRDLHDRYGSAVRIGPRHVSLNDPSLISTVYSLKGDYIKASLLSYAPKSERYKAADSKTADGHNMEIQFSTQDEKYHTELWRPVAKHYAFSSVLCLEPHLDHVIRILQRKLEEGYCFGKNTGAVCNIYNWLSFAAWEVVMMANFSQMQGYLEKGEDTDNSFEDSIEASNTFGYWGHLPWLERTRRFFSSRPVFIGALQFSLKQIAERRQLGDTYTPTVADFLDKFFETQRSCPNDFTNDRVLAQLIGNVAAGGDTTTATMSGIMYNTLKHPHVLKRLQQELDDSVQTTPVSWKVASSLPYFDAVIQESIRLHPGTSFALERIVPRQGLQLPDGRYIESGTIVGMHGWVVNRDKSVFGPNADAFVPERWLQEENEDTQAFTKRISTMKNATLSFGAGKRSCIGKHLAILEIYKIIGTLFKEFDFEFANIKGKEPRLVHSTFVRMEDFNVRLRVRERSPVIV